MRSRWFYMQSVGVLAVIFTVTQIQAADWGRIASGVAGSYAGAYIAERSGGGTAAQIGASIIGSHLAVRAYDAHQNRRRSYEEDHSDYVERESGYEYSYTSSLPPVTYRPSVAEIEREYAQFREANTAIFTKAKSDLVEQIKEIQSSQKPQWICATVCASFDEYRLKAKPIATGADKAQLAYDQLNQSCPKGAVFSDGLADNTSGSQSVKLKESQLVCFPNHMSVLQSVEHAKGQKMQVRYSVHDVSFAVSGGRKPSRKLIFETLDQLNDPATVMMSSGQATTEDVLKKVESSSDLKDQLARLNENLGPAQARPDGTLVMESKAGTPASQMVRITMRPLSQFKVKALMEMPFSVHHKCGKESGRITITSVIEMQKFEAKSQVSDNLIQMNMQAAGYSAAAKDEFCE